jgi:hypothetical protein
MDLRRDDLDRFYELLDDLEHAVGGRRRLGSATGRDGWPTRGVYFVFEPGEHRESGGDRVVRVGTHGLKTGSRSNLRGGCASIAAPAAVAGITGDRCSASTSARPWPHTSTTAA